MSGTCDFVLFYSKESNVSLVGYSDADWASNADDRKSTTGGCYYVGTNLVAWMSKKIKKNLSLYQLQKQNILMLDVVVHNFFG